MTQDTVRYTVDIDPAYRDRLAAVAKLYRINQGEVIEVLLDEMQNNPALPGTMQAKRENKVAARQPKKELRRKLASLTPAQLEAALRAVEQVQ